MRRRAVIVGLGVVAVAAHVRVVSLVVLAGGGSGGRAGSRPVAASSDAAHPATPSSGRVVVLSAAMPPPSTGTHLSAQLVSGSVPAAGSEATVLDDLNCAPDASGVSHCRNPLVLADGRRVEIVHPHSMAVVPCLTRGEHVRLVWQ